MSRLFRWSWRRMVVFGWLPPASTACHQKVEEADPSEVCADLQDQAGSSCLDAWDPATCLRVACARLDNEGYQSCDAPVDVAAVPSDYMHVPIDVESCIESGGAIQIRYCGPRPDTADYSGAADEWVGCDYTHTSP